MKTQTNNTISWPEGKRFAFTIIDDTDRSTVENVGPVYDFLYDNGFRTTKTVWPLSPRGKPIQGGHSLEDEEYRNWVLQLRERGFEIALHGVADESSARDRVIEGLTKFQQILGQPPQLHCNHTGQAEGLYWGADRFDGLVRKVYEFSVNGLGRYARKGAMHTTGFHGHEEHSPYFWGDLCHRDVTFVRNLAFSEINTLQVDPLMPYHDPRRPHVRYWFSSSVAKNVEFFCDLLSEANQDRLLEEGGACLVYTHFAFRFCQHGQLQPRFVELMTRLSKLPGWFVPASTLLAYLGEKRGWPSLSQGRQQFNQMQRRWLRQKLLRGRE